MHAAPISDTVLVALITGTLTLLAGVYGEIVKNMLARRHERLKSAERLEKEQLTAVREFLATAAELRLHSVYDSLPLTYTTISKVKGKTPRPSGRRFLPAALSQWRRVQSKPDYPTFETHPFQASMDQVKLAMGNAKLRAELHAAWETMDLQLAHPDLRQASLRVRNVIRNNEEYVGASITKPFSTNNRNSKFAMTQLDHELDNLREVSALHLGLKDR